MNAYILKLIGVVIFFIGFNPVSGLAQESCGSIVPLYGASIAITNCDDPFGVAPGPGLDVELTIAGEVVTEGGMVSVPLGGTRNIEVEYAPVFSDAAHTFYRHEDGNYIEIDLYEVQEPTEERLQELADEFFGVGVDSALYVDAYLNGSDHLTEVEEDLLFEFEDYVDANLETVPLRAGKYTLVTRDFCLILSNQSVWERIRSYIIPTVFACGPTDLYVYTRTFEIVEEDPGPEIDPLLLQYAPTLRFHPGEIFFPTDVDFFIEDSALWNGLGDDSLIKALDENNPVTIDDITPNGNETENWYLAFSDPVNAASYNVPTALEKYQTAVNEGRSKITYYSYRTEDSFVDDSENKHEFIVLQYWYFYAFNDWAEHGGFNNHEGDWESVMIFLDKDTEEPMYVAYSAHHNDDDESGNIAQYSSVRRDWDDSQVVFDEGSIVSFVSLGSHANYPMPGIHTVTPLLYYDKAEGSGRKISADDFVGKHDISSHVLTWLSYAGRWGADTVDLTGGDSGPRGPLFSDLSGIRRFHKPVEWAGVDDVVGIQFSIPEKVAIFTHQNISLAFDDLVAAGEEIAVSLHNEVVQMTDAAREKVTLLNRYWDITASLANDTFGATITMKYSPEELEMLSINPLDLVGFYYEPQNEEWLPQETVVDVDNNTISFHTTHFSRYSMGIIIEETKEELYESLRTSIKSAKLPKRDSRSLISLIKFSERLSNKNDLHRQRVSRVLLEIIERKIRRLEKKQKISNEAALEIYELLKKLINLDYAKDPIKR